MAVVAWSLLFLLCHFWVLQYTDIYTGVKKNVMPYLIGNVREASGLGVQLLSTENEWVRWEGNGVCQAEVLDDPLWTDRKLTEVSTALMVIPPKEFQTDSILMWMATMRAAILTLSALALIWGAAAIVTIWTCLVKENEKLRDTCELLHKALDIREEESQRDIHDLQYMNEEMRNLSATVQKEIGSQRERMKSIYRTYDSIIELQQQKMDALRRKLIEERSKSYEKEVKMMFDYIVPEDGMNPTSSFQDAG